MEAFVDCVGNAQNLLNMNHLEKWMGAMKNEKRKNWPVLWYRYTLANARRRDYERKYQAASKAYFAIAEQDVNSSFYKFFILSKGKVKHK
jgi:hypothetical protein